MKDELTAAEELSKKIADAEANAGEAVKVAKETGEEVKQSIAEVSGKVDGLAEDLNSLSNKIEQKESNGVKEDALKNWLEDEKNKQAIKAVHDAGHGSVALKLVTVGTSVTTDPVPPIAVLDNPRPANFRLSWWQENAGIVRSLGTSTQGSYAYAEVLPDDNEFELVLEGGLKPELGLSLKTSFAEPLKAAGYVPITEEAWEDIPQIESIIRSMLRGKHDLKKGRVVLDQVTTIASPFAAGALANTVTDTNIMDIIHACGVQIYTTENFQDDAQYVPNVAFMNPIDYYVYFQAKKDNEGRPLYDGTRYNESAFMENLIVIPSVDIAQGKILVGDFMQLSLINRREFDIRFAWINDDAIRNQFVIIGESRFFAFVETLKQKAFVYDDIATIETAITVI